MLRASAEAGLPALQVRERDLPTRALLDLVADIAGGPWVRRPKILVNDRLDVAVAAGVDGVHLRADSLPTSAARLVLGAERLIGVSTHSSEDVRRAEAEGADFVVLGPIYETPSKRVYGAPLGLPTLEAASRSARLPVFAIGGVTAARVAELRQAGAFGVAVLSALLAADDIRLETDRFLRELDRPP